MNLAPTIVTDLDGTLALPDGTVNPAVAEVVQALFDSGWDVAVLSDRLVERLVETEAWLNVNGFSFIDVTYRWADDTRPAAERKREDIAYFLTFCNVRLALDDDPAVVRMFREMGIPAFQVADDDGNPLPAVPVV